MSSEPYTKREIDMMTKDLKDVVEKGFSSVYTVMEDHTKRDVREHQLMTSAVTELSQEVKKTNGRVRFLEKMVWMGLGALTVLSFIVANGFLNL